MVDAYHLLKRGGQIVEEPGQTDERAQGVFLTSGDGSRPPLY
jgi:hypothetical protein